MNHTDTTHNQMGHIRILLVLSLLMGFASISTDLYLPAMPAMGQDLHVHQGMIAWTVSSYLIGFSTGQLIWGPISDRFGRRKPVVTGLLFFIIGSAGCALSGNIWMILFWRVVQAIGACASVTISRAMIRDLYSGTDAARMMSLLMTIMAIAPLIGPMIGGQILIFSGWRSIFWLLVVIGILTLAAVMTTPETLKDENKSRNTVLNSVMNYFRFANNRTVIASAGIGGFFYGGVYAYIAGSPFAYISYHHLKPQYYGIFFGLNIIGIMVTNMLNNKILNRFGSRKIMIFGGTSLFVSGTLIALGGFSDFGGLFGIVIPMFFYVGMNGFLVANSIAKALENYPANAGSVSALLGAAQYGSGILGTGLTGLFADGTPWPMCAIMAVCGFGAMICTLTLPKSAGR